MDCIVHGVTKSQKRLSNFHFDFTFRASQVALVVKNLPANTGDIGDVGSIPGSGRSPGGGNGNPLQYSCLENPMDRGAWKATVHGVTELDTAEVPKRVHTHTYKHTRVCVHAQSCLTHHLLKGHEFE